MLVGVVLVGDEVVDAFEEGGEGFAVVFFLRQKTRLCKHSHQIHQPITRVFAQISRIRRDIRHDCHNTFVDGFEEAGACVDQFVGGEEDEVGVCAGFGDLHVKFDRSVIERCVQRHSQLAAARHTQQHENAQVHKVALRRVFLRFVQKNQQSKDKILMEILPLCKVLEHMLYNS